MINLHIRNTEIQTGSVEVSWTVSQGLLDKLAEEKVKDPQLLLIVTHRGDYNHETRPPERRFLVPLTALTTFVTFTRPGVNRIVGLLVYKRGDHTTENFFMTKYNDRYNNDVLSPSDGEVLEPIHLAWPSLYLLGGDRCRLEETSASIEVEVPEGVFAKRSWDHWWVNLCFGPPRDECNMWHRRLLAYSFQGPVLVVLALFLLAFMFLYHVVVRIVFVLITILLGRWRGLSELMLTENPLDIFDSEYVFQYKASPLQFILAVACTPLIPILATFGVWYFGDVAFANSFWIGIGGAVGVGVALVLVILGVGCIFDLFDKRKTASTTTPQLWYERDEERAALTRADAPERAKRTLKLRYYDYKAKSCKPYPN